MVANRSKSLTIVDGSSTYTWPIIEENGARKIQWTVRQWQPGDLTSPFRISIFPLSGGLARDRLSRNDVYGKMNGDASVPHIWRHPPKINTLNFTNGTTPSKILQFAGKMFYMAGRYMNTVDPATHALAEDKDFGVGKAAVDMAVFNNELVVAMGETEKIWTRTAAGVWTQATDNTFAIALGVVDDKLWRAEETNEISNCLTAPLTLASWVPSDGNEYQAGDLTWAVNSITDFQGSQAIGKGDGVYLSDPTFAFHNQTPGIKRNPHTDNCKGTFTAHASIWVPYFGGLYRIRLGSAYNYGPEITYRKDYRWWIRGGVEANGGNIYLIADDMAAVGETCIVKMIPVDEKRSAYIYHEWARLGNTTKGYAIAFTSGVGTNPELYIAHGDDGAYITLGRGGGLDVDDANYAYGTSGSGESGVFKPGPDMSILSVLEGVEVVCDYSAANESLTVSYSIDDQADVNFLNNQDGAGTAPITLTTNWQSVKRYAAKTAEGQFLNIKWASTLVTTTSSPEIMDIIAFGYLRPLMTDIVTIALVADGGSWNAYGVAPGLNANQSFLKFRQWIDLGTRVELRMQEYDDSKTTVFQVIDIKFGEGELEEGEAGTPAEYDNLVVTFIRVPYGVGEYAP